MTMEFFQFFTYIEDEDLYDYLNFQNLLFVTWYDARGCLNLTYWPSESNEKRPRVSCIDLNRAYSSADPYHEFWYLFHYCAYFEKFVIDSEVDFCQDEVGILKLEFWKSIFLLNRDYSHLYVLWFLQFEDTYLRNLLSCFSAIDYLHTIWAYGNCLKSLQNIKTLIKSNTPYLKEFAGNLEKPGAFALPPYALIRVINLGFAFGIKAKPLNLLKIWHKLFLRNLRRIKKEKEPIPHSIWQKPIIYKMSRKRKNELYARLHAHKQRVWKWKVRYFQLIEIEEHNNRTQSVWKRFNTRLIFYAR